MIHNKLHTMSFEFLYAISLVIALLAVPLSTASASSPTDVSTQGQTVRVFFSPAQAMLPPNTTFRLQLDAGSSQIAFVQIALTFDPSMIQLTNEIQTTSLLSTLVQKTSKATANSTGQIMITLALSPGAVPPTGVFEFAQLPFRSVTTDPNQSTYISVLDQNVQIVNSSAVELPFVSEAAVLNLNPVPLPSAEFDAWPTSGTAPLTVDFHLVDTSNLTSCSWSYGDGQTGTSCASYHTHTYDQVGTYTVALTVSGPGGSDTLRRDNYILVGSQLRTLLVNKTGTGSGRIISNPMGINCGSNCSYNFNHNTVVTLNATADAGSTFTGWSGGGCAGTAACVVSMIAATSITANFNMADPEIFGDVPSDHWAKDFIERLYDAGITGGCAINPLNYCPETVVNRAQMAVFLERGIHGSAYNPPGVGSSTGFGDVPTNHWAATWIKQLAADGITGGCGNGTYCPESPVTRAQMAVFLLRSKYGAGYAPPPVGGGMGFGDVQSTHWAGAWIKQLVAEGITAGCGNGNYCPDAPVTRAQMAVFLVRTFNLP